MQPAELESAPCSGLVSSTVDTDDDSDVFVRVWSCPGELGVPVDDADALQPKHFSSVSVSDASEVAHQPRSCPCVDISAWVQLALCVVCWPLAIYTWYRFSNRNFSDVHWQLRTCTAQISIAAWDNNVASRTGILRLAWGLVQLVSIVFEYSLGDCLHMVEQDKFFTTVLLQLLGLIDRPGCCTISVEVTDAEAPSESPQPAMLHGREKFSVPSPAAAPLDLITVQMCSSLLSHEQSACAEVSATAELQSQYGCYVQSDDDKFAEGDFASADLSCFTFGLFSLVDAVPVGMTDECTQKFARNAIQTNSSLGVFESRAFHLGTLCIAVSATVGLLVSIVLRARSRIIAGTSKPVSSHARVKTTNVDEHFHATGVSCALPTSTRNITLHLPQSGGLVEQALPEIQVIGPNPQLVQPVAGEGEIWDYRRRRSI